MNKISHTFPVTAPRLPSASIVGASSWAPRTLAPYQMPKSRAQASIAFVIEG